MPALILTHSDGNKSFALNKRITSIGSDSSNDIVITGDGVEPSHALVQFTGSDFVIQNLSSSGETFINEEKSRRAKMDDGAEVRLGNVRLEFELFEREDPVENKNQRSRMKAWEQTLSFAESLLEASSAEELFPRLMDAVIELTEADKGFLILRDGEELTVPVARNVEREDIQDAEGRFSDSIVQAVLDSREPIIVSDALSDETFGSSESVLNLQLCSVMCVPLQRGTELLGLLYVGNNNVVNLFEHSHLEALKIFSGFAALALQNQQTLDSLRERTRSLEKERESLRFGTIIGSCDAMQRIYERLEKIAPTDVSVLVRGETGTGKELIARELHLRSNRSQNPFVTVNCGAIPPELLESELFGHVRGAFTGASSDRVGRFEAADTGTVFLDEIGELSPSLQVKLLRVLQERQVTRVGSNDERPVDVRVIAATNRDLEAAIEDGSFREDLYYRLNVVDVRLPPLRDRGDDALLIARYFVERHAEELQLKPKRFSKESIEAILRAEWPGNIRQLENHVRKALILSENPQIEPEDLAIPDAEQQRIVPLSEAREQWQLQYVERVLSWFGGNRTKTAEALEIDPRTLYRYLQGSEE
jgi:transcriptional regulator with GAF, ATPase, and Fis domain